MVLTDWLEWSVDNSLWMGISESNITNFFSLFSENNIFSAFYFFSIESKWIRVNFLSIFSTDDIFIINVFSRYFLVRLVDIEIILWGEATVTPLTILNDWMASSCDVLFKVTEQTMFEIFSKEYPFLFDMSSIYFINKSFSKERSLGWMNNTDFYSVSIYPDINYNYFFVFFFGRL